MATGTAMATLEQGKETKGAADAMKAEAEEHMEHFNTLKAAIMDFAGSPVVGPVVFWIMHRIVACFTVAFFFYTLIAAVPSFSAKVTSAEVEYLTDYQLPDIYSCLDGSTMKTFLTKKRHGVIKEECEKAETWPAQCQFEMMDGSTRYGTYASNGARNVSEGRGGNVMQFRSGLSSDTRCGVYNMAYHNLQTDGHGVEDVGECPVEQLRWGAYGYYESDTSKEGDPIAEGVETPEFADRRNFRPWKPWGDTGEDSYPDGGFDEKATILASLLPNATGEIIYDDGTPATVSVPAFCFKHVIRDGAKSYYETNQDLVLSSSNRIFPPEATENSFGGIVFTMYFAEPGTPPYMEHEGQWRLNATRLFIAGANTVTKIDLRPLSYKDETIGMSSYTMDFEQSTSFSTPSYTPLHSPDRSSEPTENAFMFTFLHFARKVTIRYKTISEIWAEVGGLWAAATLIMALVFSQSGTTDPRNKKPSVIFNFLPSKMRKKWIEENNMKLEAAEAADEEVGKNTV
jgi:hypothetical protein